MQRLDVTDFATPVFTVDALRANRRHAPVIAAAADYEQVAYQSDNHSRSSSSRRRASAAARAAAIRTGIHGRAPHAELPGHRDARGAAAARRFQRPEHRRQRHGQGSVTLRLQNVPWDQALDIVMTTKGLDMRRNGNVIIVAPAEEIAAREQARARGAQQASRQLAAAALRVHPGQLREGGRARRARSSRGAGSSLLSERGSVAIDERTNTLLVQDTSEQPRGHPPPGHDARHPGAPGARSRRAS